TVFDLGALVTRGVQVVSAFGFVAGDLPLVGDGRARGGVGLGTGHGRRSTVAGALERGTVHRDARRFRIGELVVQRDPHAAAGVSAQDEWLDGVTLQAHGHGEVAIAGARRGVAPLLVS